MSSTSLNAAVQNRILTSMTASGGTALTQTIAPRALKATDLGAVNSSLLMDDMTLRFGITDAAQADLTELLLEQQQPGSANYHKWLTPEQFADRFGLSVSDVNKVSAWLTSQGFKVSGIGRSRTFISFSGTAAQVSHAFSTTIHTVSLDGETHYANLTDPVIPTAMAGVVTGITGLHNFHLVPRAKTRMVAAPVEDALHANFTSSTSGSHYIAPGDFYTIYDETPLMAAAVNGSGVTIAVMGQTDISLSDVAAFRTASGLSTNAPTVKVYGTDPGTSTNDLPEAQLDVEWSGAAAPSASILYVNSTDVIDTSLTQAIDNNLAPIMTISYGDCESDYGTASLKSFNLLFQQANAQGITVVGPAGDSGAADCDYEVASATQGLAVDFPASSPYVTGVGGTMFNEGSGSYWNTSNNTYGGSAISYIPEAVWNESTTSEIAAGGGGASAYFTKPAWQVGTGVPVDFSRDVPDLSLNAAASHDGYLFCSSGSCVTGYRTAAGYLDVVGGTSVSTPSFAGLLSLVVQKTGGRIGNANPILYALANSTYYGNVFHDVTTGSNAVTCTAGTTGCVSGGTIGYSAGTGYDLATGWGSVDAYQMVSTWSLVTPLGTSAGQVLSATTLTTTTPNVTQGTAVTLTASVASSSSTSTTTPTGTVQLLVDGVASGSAVAVTSGTATLTLPTTTLSSGTHTIAAAYSGDGTYTGSKGTVSVDVTSTTTADFSITGSVTSVTVASGGTAAGITYTVKSLNGFAGSVTLTANGSINASGGFSVSPVVLTAAGSGTSVFTLYAYVSNGGTSIAAPITAANHGGTPWMVATSGMAFASLMLLVIPGRKRRKLRGAAGIFSVVLLSIAAIGISGCTGSGGRQVVTSSQTNTPTGTYQVVITGTSGTISHNANLTVVVQ